MSWKRIIKATEQERAYRQKYCHDIRMIKDRQIVCSTCDNELNIETKRIFSHPFIGILQCEVCWKHFKNIQLKFDEEKSRNHCHICGGNKKLFVCCNKDCFSACCKGCIKRNVSSSLLDVEKEDWKCFICNPKPIWDLRAVCATVMDSLSKKGNKRSFNKIEKRSLPSQIREKMRELQRSLQKFCDKEDDDSSEKSFVSSRITQKNRTNPNTNSIQQKLILEVDLTYSSSEDLSRARNKNLSALSKRNKQSKGERDQKAKSVRNSTQKVSRSVLKEKITSKKSKISSDSDDDSTHTSSNKTGKRTVKRNSSEKIKRKTNCIHSSDSESDENDTNRVSSVSKRILKDTRQRNNKMDNFYNAKSKDRTKKYDLSSESEDEDKKRNRRERSKRSRMIPYSNNDERKRNESSKQRLSDIQKDDSDISFGKECQKIKLQKANRKYSRRQLVDLDVDHTKSPKKYSTNDKSGKDINEQSNLNVSYIKKILTACKKTCLNFQMYIEKSIEQLYGKQKNEKQLVLQSIEKIDNLVTTLKKRSKNLTTWQLWCRNKKKSTVRRRSNKIVSDNEQYSEEREKHTVSMNKHISGDEQDGNKAVFKCDSEEIFSADETRSPRKIQTTGRKVDTARTENNLNNNETNTNDENRMLVNGSKNNDKNNVGTRDDLAASPVLNLKERKANMKRSNKKQVFSECNKSNKTQLTGENTNNKQASLKTDMKYETEIEDQSNKKNIINESMDMFNTSSEDAKVSRTQVELNVETNCYKDEFSHTSKDTSLDPCKSSLQDIISSEKERASLLTDDSGKEKDLSTQDNQEKVASVFASNEEADNDLKPFGKTNLDDSKSLDDAEPLAKKALLVTDSDSDPISDENVAKPTEDLIANDADRTEMKDATGHNNSDVNSVSAVKFSTLVKEASTDAEKNTAIEVKTEAEEKKNDSPDKKSRQEMNSSEDEDAKAEKAAKKALLESNLNDSTLLSLSSESEKLVDKKTESDSSEKNAKAKLSLLASFSESSSSEMANISRSTKRAHEAENDRESIVSTIKKRRFKLDKNHYYQNNEKLRMSCKVHLTQLNTEVFKSYSYALRKSREYLEHKALKSFVNLDKLEKRRKENAKEDSASLTDDDLSSKISKSSNKLKGKTKVKEETLMDHFEKVQDSDVMATVEISSDTEESVCQIKNIDDIPMSNEALISEADRIAKNNLLNSSDSNEKQSSQGKERELQVRLEKLMPKEIILLTQKKLPEKMTIKSQRNGDFIIDGPSTSTARHSSSDLVSVDSKHSEKAICITDSQITKASDKKENSPPCSPWTNSKNVAKFKMNTKTLFACPHCGVPFSSKHCVAHHVNKTCLSNPYSRTNREAGRHQCQQCGRNYGKEKSLRHHQKHECNQRVTCEKCGSTFQGTIVPVRHRKKCGIDQNSSKIEKMMKKENTRDEPFEDDSSVDFSD